MTNKNIARTTALGFLVLGLALAAWIWPDEHEPSRLMLGSVLLCIFTLAAFVKAWTDIK